MTAKEKDEIVRLILDNYTPGRRFAVSYIIPIDDRMRMANVVEVVLELSRKGLVSQTKPVAEDLVFTVNSELKTFSERGGFESEDIMYQAEVQKVILEIKKLESDIEPGLFHKIVKILEPLSKLAGIADVLTRFP